MKPSRWPLLITLTVVLFFYLPILVLAGQSFNSSRFGGSWTGFTLKWYRLLWEHPQIWAAARNTLIVAFSATLVSTTLGTLAAWVLHRYRSRLQSFHGGLVYSPLVVPEILMGISLLLLFVNLRIQLGLATIILAHITFCLSYVVLVVLGRLQDFDGHLIEAAQDLGAGWPTIVRRILLPLLGPGIAAGALLSMTLSVDDFVITFFVAGPGSNTLPVLVYSMMKHGTPTLINALCTLFMAVTFAVVVAAQRFLPDRAPKSRS